MAEANESSSPPAERFDARQAPGGLFSRLYQSKWQPFFLIVGLGSAAIFVRVALQFQVPLPFCMLRRFTGVPCPACGSTRSLLAWAHFEPLQALRLNPLFFLITISVAGWAMATLTDRWLGTRWVERMELTRERWTTARILIPFIVANWLYLCLTLPK